MSHAVDDLPDKVVWARRGMLARFTPEIEKAFVRYHERDLLQRARWSAAIAAAVMTVYAILDIFMIPPEIMPSFLWVRGLFMILPLVAVWWLSYNDWGTRHLQRIGAATAVSSGLAVIAMLCIARDNGTPIAWEGLMLTMFYFYCCGGLRMRWSLLAGVVAGVAYPLAEGAVGMSQEDVVVRTLFLVSANVVGFVSAALMENASRRHFAQRVQLAAIGNADPLTGLLSRRALDRRAERLWQDASASGQLLCIAMIDVDHFKAYNDHYGHAAGDAALRDVAHILDRHCSGPRDLAGRYGGEEFLCIWIGDQAAFSNTLHDIMQAVETTQLHHARAPLNRLSLSIGAIVVQPATFDPLNPQHAIAEVQRQADALLYEAKSRGRNMALTAQAWRDDARDTLLVVPSHVRGSVAQVA